jgi:hypothetical protein
MIVYVTKRAKLYIKGGNVIALDGTIDLLNEVIYIA